jgi:peptidoglycan/LPS O-acetylase OafA/YrhL
VKLRSIQALRGIAVLGVVAYHALAVERKYSGGDRLLPDFLSFGQTGIDLLFVISGFVIVTVTQGRFGGIRELPRFLWSRITRIYPTYWFYFLITLRISWCCLCSVACGRWPVRQRTVGWIISL